MRGGASAVRGAPGGAMGVHAVAAADVTGFVSGQKNENGEKREEEEGGRGGRARKQGPTALGRATRGPERGAGGELGERGEGAGRGDDPNGTTPTSATEG